MPPTEVKEPEQDKIFTERFEHEKKERERVAKETALPEPEKPGRKASGALNRAGMEQLIKEGGSVLHAGKIYSKLEDLPDEATLTKGDEQASAAGLAGIDAQMAALAAQRAALAKTHDENVKGEKGDKGEKAEPAHPHKR